jgi:hypothetical protein
MGSIWEKREKNSEKSSLFIEQSQIICPFYVEECGG